VIYIKKRKERYLTSSRGITTIIGKEGKRKRKAFYNIINK